MINGIIIPVLCAILGVVLGVYFLKFRNRLRIVPLKKGQTTRIDKFVDLYLERIPEDQRVPPGHFVNFLNSPRNATSVHEFGKKVASGVDTVHFLLLATSNGEVIGFTKVIYVKEISSLFVAYIAVSNNGSEHEQHVVSILLSKVLQYAKASRNVNKIIYEIVINDGGHISRERLFRHYADSKNYRCKKFQATYYQPEVCSFEAGECGMERANLFVLELYNQNQDWTRNTYEELIRSIYKFIYLESFLLADYKLSSKYQYFLESIVNMTMAEQHGDIILAV
jgi:hypothetical protein